MRALLWTMFLSLLIGSNQSEDVSEEEHITLSIFSASAVATSALPQRIDEDPSEERSTVTPPSVAFYVSWAPKNDPNGLVECGDIITISVTISINPGSFQPSSVDVTNILDPYTSLVPASVRSSLGYPVEQAATSPNSISVSVGPLPSFTISTLTLTFDAKMTEYFSGVLVLARNDVYVQIDNWPTYSNVGKPNVFFTCQVCMGKGRRRG